MMMTDVPTMPSTELRLPDQPLDRLLDQQLHQLLVDLQLILPYDVAAAWLGHDARPSLRVVVPNGAQLPGATSTRHWIFETAVEGARIADLFVDEGPNPQGLRCWIGVPLMMDGRRRGWIELLSTQPNLFSDADLRRVEMVVRHAATALAQSEAAFRSQSELAAQRDVVRGLERALVAPALTGTLAELLASAGMTSHAVAGRMFLPAELAYALGLRSVADVPDVADDPTGLVALVAQWQRDGWSAVPPPAVQLDADGTAPTAGSGDLLLPLGNGGETLGWLWLHYAVAQPLTMVNLGALGEVTALLTAVLTWLREQAQREQQAQQSVRMLVQHAHQERSGAISDLMAGLAHELNNPLSAVLGVAELLRRDTSLPDEARADAELIVAEVNRIGEFVKRLANFSQMTGATKAPVALADVVSDTLAVVGGLALQRCVTITYQPPAESPMVLGNRAQLQQVCLDLLGNAIEALETAEAPEVTIAVGTEGRWALLEVRDNGYGIPEDLRERIWTPGFTTKTAGGARRGLGIGLPMALDIVRRHWGTVGVTSEVWQGSCFTVRLPLI